MRSKNVNRVRAVVMLFTTIIGLGLTVCPTPIVMKSLEIDSFQDWVLEELLVGTSQALAYVESSAVNWGAKTPGAFEWGWNLVGDRAVIGKACVATDTEAGHSLLASNVTATLSRVGDLAADLIGALPLIVAIEQIRDYGLIDGPISGWLVFDQESLHAADIPPLILADARCKDIADRADRIAKNLFSSSIFPSWLDVWTSGYYPGLGMYIDIDLCGTELPPELNTPAEWRSFIHQALEVMADEIFLEMVEAELLIIGVEGFDFYYKLFFVIDQETLADPLEWEIEVLEW